MRDNLQPENLNNYIRSRTIKDQQKMSMSKENQELIDKHNKDNMNNNFIMKALKRHRQKESGV